MQQKDIHQLIEIPVDPALPDCLPVCLEPDQFVDHMTDRVMFSFLFLCCIQEEYASSVRRESQKCPVRNLDDAQNPFRLIAVGFHRIDQNHISLLHVGMIIPDCDPACAGHYIKQFNKRMRILFLLRILHDIDPEIPIVSHPSTTSVSPSRLVFII